MDRTVLGSMPPRAFVRMGKMRLRHRVSSASRSATRAVCAKAGLKAFGVFQVGGVFRKATGRRRAAQWAAAWGRGPRVMRSPEKLVPTEERPGRGRLRTRPRPAPRGTAARTRSIKAVRHVSVDGVYDPAAPREARPAGREHRLLPRLCSAVNTEAAPRPGRHVHRTKADVHRLRPGRKKRERAWAGVVRPLSIQKAGRVEVGTPPWDARGRCRRTVPESAGPRPHSPA